MAGMGKDDKSAGDLSDRIAAAKAEVKAKSKADKATRAKSDKEPAAKKRKPEPKLKSGPPPKPKKKRKPSKKTQLAQKADKIAEAKQLLLEVAGEHTDLDRLDDDVLPENVRRSNKTKAEQRFDEYYSEGVDRGLKRSYILFAIEYVKDSNASRAARDAGYATKAAGQQGHDLLKIPKIEEFIQYLTAKTLQRQAITSDWIIREYENMASANILDYIKVTDDGLAVTDLSTMTRDQAAGLAGLEIIELPPVEEDGPCPLKVKFKMTDKKAALDVLAKRAGLLKEDTLNLNLTGTMKMDPEDTQDLAKRVAFLLRSAAQKDKAPA